MENVLGVPRKQQYPRERPIRPGDVAVQAEEDAQELRSWVRAGVGSGSRHGAVLGVAGRDAGLCATSGGIDFWTVRVYRGHRRLRAAQRESSNGADCPDRRSRTRAPHYEPGGTRTTRGTGRFAVTGRAVRIRFRAVVSDAASGRKPAVRGNHGRAVPLDATSCHLAGARLRGVARSHRSAAGGFAAGTAGDVGLVPGERWNHGRPERRGHRASTGSVVDAAGR